MDGATFIRRFREETADEAQPYLWSDALILRYLDEAQTEFCRRTEGIEDSGSRVCSVAVPAGASAVALNPKIRKVRSAHLVGYPYPLEIASIEGTRYAPTSTGTPHTLILGLGSGKARLYPTPTTDVVLHLDVFRLPLNAIEANGDETEIDDAYAPALMYGALYRAYSRPDADTMDRTKAEYFRGVFADECARAMREQGRARKPNGATLFSW